MNNNIYISIVTPVYGCCKSLNNLYERLNRTLSTITENFEIIMVNDASPDNAWEAIKELAKKDDRVKGINLSRNFGQHKAITAGLDYANGDWVVVMDCDLQDQPEEIIKLYNKAQEGYDIVFGRRAQRQDGFFKKLSSRLFYKVYDYFTESKVDNTIANFSIISKKVLHNLKKLKEQNRMYPLFINWIGFNKAEIDIEHASREEGKSSYTLKKLIDLAIDSIVSQSNKPLKLSIKFGFIVSFLSLIYAFWLTIRYFLFSIPVEGWTSVMVSIYFIGGLLFANMGILGLYIGKIFDETKNRPIYVVQESTFEKKEI
ncbi:glycosyltransferase [Arcobacter sp. AHV-9/2010]|uniref:glycosyltransferase family 2 protein n=1 Tax=Arcobacter sp. AHV-9/2010 TaxID=2021861 RepID=UPI00100C251A|nr:glycosyltransferase family 2 protein [Arcobacter sp. CECT 9299]RXJ95861.1 glycosyltransferase [Arcobacter sp. CECT 9299]